MNFAKNTFLHYMDAKFDDVELDITPYNDEEVSEPKTLSGMTINYIDGDVKTQTRTHNSNVVTWFHGVGNAYKQKLATINCNFQGTDCYDVRIMPSITSISATGGYTTGGQELIITGTSLNGTAIVAEVDGEPCTVTSSSTTEVKCSTGPKTLPVSTPSIFVGQHGLRQKHYEDDGVN